MRIEIIVLAALAALASAAPQWPYRDAVAPYYYGYPGKTPYMYRANDEDDEMDETYMARQDLKVATSDGSSSVVLEDDEKADGVRVVETGSAKPVVQSGNNNQVQQDQQPAAQSSSLPAQAQQPLNSNANNANNNAQPSANNGQPLTVQQSGQQPPAFPPARPNQQRPQKRPVEEEDEEDDDEDSEEDDEDAEDEEDDNDDEDEDEEEEDEDRKRNLQKDSSASEEPTAPQIIEPQPIQQSSPVVNNESSDEIVQEEQAAPVVEQQPISQQAVVKNKVIKNKQSGGAAAGAAIEKPRKKSQQNSKTKSHSGGAIEALVPGYVTDQGEVLVPVDTVTGSQPITIVPDPFSPPSRIVAGPRPIPQSAVPSTTSRQVPFWYRSSPAINPLTQEIPAPMGRQTLYSAVPPPGSIFTFDDDDDDDDAPAVIPRQRLRQDAADDDDDDDEDEEADQKAQPKPPQKVPLAAVPAVGNSGEDDEAEALTFVNSGKPTSNRRPQSTSSSTSSASGNKKPAGSSTGGANQGTSNESESEEDESNEAEDEEEEEDEEDEEDDSAARRVVVGSPARLATSAASSKGRMYVDEELVSFPPSRSPTLFAVIQGKFPVPYPNRQQPQIFSSPNPNNPFQRYVVRVTPSNRVPRPPQGSSPLYYRPISTPYGGSTSNKRVVPIASFDVSVEDTRPSGISSGPSSIIVDSDEEGDFSGPGGPTPVTTYPFVYKVQGSLQGLRLPSGGPRPGPYGAIRPPRPSASGYYGPPPSGSGSRPRPSYGSYGPPPLSILNALYGGSSYGSRPSPSFSFGPRPSQSFSYGPPPRPSGISDGPPHIIRKKPSGGSNRPPKPHLIAVYNPTGPSSGPREPVDEEYYTFEVPETENKFVQGGAPPKKNKRPTVHRKPTPVIKQKTVSQDEEASDESPVGPHSGGPQVMPIRIIPQGTVRRRIRGGKQLKPKKNLKKTSSTPSKKQQNQQDQHDPLGLLSKINKSKSKLH